MAEKKMDELYSMPGHLIRRFQQIAVAIFMSEVQTQGLEITPVQFAALATTKAHPGLDQATLAGFIAYDRTTIGGVVDRLVQKGYIVRQISDRDRRARELRLTELGCRILQMVDPAVARAQDMMLSGLDGDEKAVFMTLLRKATSAANGRSRAPLRKSGYGIKGVLATPVLEPNS